MLLEKFYQKCQELLSDENLEELCPSDARRSMSWELAEYPMHSNDSSCSPCKQKPKVTSVC